MSPRRLRLFDPLIRTALLRSTRVRHIARLRSMETMRAHIRARVLDHLD